MSNDTYDRLKVEAREKGYPGIAAYLLSKVDGLTTDAEAHDIVKRAKLYAEQKDVNCDPFTLKGLFPKEIWNAYSKSARIAAGRMFFAEVEVGFIEGVKEAEKTGSNHQTYTRYEE